MSVSNYINNQCRYNGDRLEDVVYLINESAVRNIKIDDGEAYIESIVGEMLEFECYNLSFEDSSSLKGRYAFVHKVTFSMHGYANYKDLDGRYYVILKTRDGSYWLVNPSMPSKVTYTYILGEKESHSDFTLATISQYPTLRVVNMDKTTPYTCKGYKYLGIKHIMLNDSNYCDNEGNEIKYSNGGFSGVYHIKGSAVFKEEYNGSSIQHSLSFSIRFDDYKSSWHYNLLEFQENTYAAVIELTNGDYVLCGFKSGLMPQFVVSCSDETASNEIDITLRSLFDDGDTLDYITGVTYSRLTDTHYSFTKEYAECTSNKTARYLLKREYDVFNNPLDKYLCLEGYEDEFDFLNIVGTFAETEEFYSHSCLPAECTYSTSFPSVIEFNSVGTKQFTLSSNSYWNLSSSNSHIKVSPTSGEPNKLYRITVDNDLEPSDFASTSNIVLTYCDELSTAFEVVVRKGASCFTMGKRYEVSANAQYLTISSDCCIKSVVDDSRTITYIKPHIGYVRVYVPNNGTSAERTIELRFTFCDDTEEVATIVQSSSYQEWVTEGTSCSDGKQCDVQRLYSGTSSTAITTPTSTMRLANCVDSPNCFGVLERWVKTTSTVCVNTTSYYVESQEVSYDNGDSWELTDIKRLGDVYEVNSQLCEEGVTYVYDWIRSDHTQCDGVNKYYLYLKQRRAENGDVWEDCVPTVLSIDGEGTQELALAEANSTDCGYVAPINPIYRWKMLDETDYLCVGTTKHYREAKEVSYDRGYTWQELPFSRIGGVIEENSYDCGYSEIYEWRPIDGYVCSNGNKYSKLQRFVTYDSGESWEAVVPNLYKMGMMIEASSADCGKLYATYSDETTYALACDSSSAVTMNEVMGHSTSYTAMTEAEIGDCVTRIDHNAFDVCSSLTSVTIPNTVTYIGYHTFSNCSSLPSITIPSSVTSFIRPNFENCTALTSITVDASNTVYDSRDNCNAIIHSATNKLIQGCKTTVIPNTVTSISYSAFQNCTSLTSITIPSSVTTIGAYAFYNCTSLASVTIGNGVTYIGDRAFIGCSRLEAIIIKATTPPTVASTAFYDTNNCPIYVPCESLRAYKNSRYWSTYADRIVAIETCNEKLYAEYSDNTYYTLQCNSSTTLSTTDTRGHSTSYTAMTEAEIGSCVAKLGDYCFSGNTSLTSVTIPNSVTSIGIYTFGNCTSLSSITIPNSVTAFSDSVFYNCTSLTSVTLSESQTTLGNGTFESCRSLASITIPSSVTRIGTQTFYNCTSLTSVTIPSSVTSIGTQSLRGCTALTNITIPSSVTTIGASAFYNCRSLTNITVEATTPPTLGSSAFLDTNNCPIYVPSESVETYKTATNWSTYADRIQAIS